MADWTDIKSSPYEWMQKPVVYNELLYSFWVRGLFWYTNNQSDIEPVYIGETDNTIVQSTDGFLFGYYYKNLHTMQYALINHLYKTPGTIAYFHPTSFPSAGASTGLTLSEFFSTYAIDIDDLYDITGLAYGFRRATEWDPAVNDWTDYNDDMFSYGIMQHGDILGPWLIEDLRICLDKLTRVGRFEGGYPKDGPGLWGHQSIYAYDETNFGSASAGDTEPEMTQLLFEKELSGTSCAVLTAELGRNFTTDYYDGHDSGFGQDIVFIDDEVAYIEEADTVIGTHRTHSTPSDITSYIGEGRYGWSLMFSDGYRTGFVRVINPPYETQPPA